MGKLNMREQRERRQANTGDWKDKMIDGRIMGVEPRKTRTTQQKQMSSSYIGPQNVLLGAQVL